MDEKSIALLLNFAEWLFKKGIVVSVHLLMEFISEKQKEKTDE